MIISTTGLIYALKALVSGSTFFVWVVRYQNIAEEFKSFGLPVWLRDLVGILKLSFVIMLFSNDLSIVPTILFYSTVFVKVASNTCSVPSIRKAVELTGHYSTTFMSVVIRKY